MLFSATGMSRDDRRREGWGEGAPSAPRLCCKRAMSQSEARVNLLNGARAPCPPRDRAGICSSAEQPRFRSLQSWQKSGPPRAHSLRCLDAGSSERALFLHQTLNCQFWAWRVETRVDVWSHQLRHASQTPASMCRSQGLSEPIIAPSHARPAQLPPRCVPSLRRRHRRSRSASRPTALLHARHGLMFRLFFVREWRGRGGLTLQSTTAWGEEKGTMSVCRLSDKTAPRCSVSRLRGCGDDEGQLWSMVQSWCRKVDVRFEALELAAWLGGLGNVGNRSKPPQVLVREVTSRRHWQRLSTRGEEEWRHAEPWGSYPRNRPLGTV